jgi:glycosyltransferase involved in cell wall biosynthesis
MKIAVLAPFEEPVPPKKYGGIELVVYNLVEQLISQGHKVTLYASGDSYSSAKLVPVVPKALRSLPELRNLRVHEAMTYHGLVGVVRHIRNRDFDIIHNHMGWPFFVMQEFVRVPVVTTLHNSLASEYERSFEERYMFNLNPSAPLVSISLSQRRAAPHLNYVSNVYNGIDVDAFEYNESPQDYLAFLGRFSPEKGPEQAISLAKRTGHKLIMAGKINSFEEEYFRRKIQPKIDGKQILFIGEVGHAEKVELLKNAKALISPLKWNEPFGLTNVEAMACGTPVITTEKGSLPEIISDGKTGFLCPTIAEMARAVRNVESIKRADCRKHVERNFSAARMASGYVAAYKKVMAENKRLAWHRIIEQSRNWGLGLPHGTLGRIKKADS